VVAVVGVAFGVVSTVFHRADVSLFLKTYAVPVAESFEASPDGAQLSFTLRSVTETMNKTVPRSGSEYTEEKTSGTITVFNAYSKSSQRLIANTRFQTPEGLVYRIQKPLVVPGYTLQNGKIVPGEINTTVYADEAGEKHNIGSAAFTIPGLKGSPQFDSMYARSDEAFSGGFVGQKAIVSPEIRDAAISELKSELDRKVRARIVNSVAENEVFFPDTIVITFLSHPDRSVDDGAVVTLTAEAGAPIFDHGKLAQIIAQEGNVSYGGPLRIGNINELAVLTGASKTEGNRTLTISGNATLVGAYDTKQLLDDLSGKDRRTVGAVLSGYPAIADMKISVYPFWRGVLPNDPSKIKIHILETNNSQ